MNFARSARARIVGVILVSIADVVLCVCGQVLAAFPGCLDCRLIFLRNAIESGQSRFCPISTPLRLTVFASWGGLICSQQSLVNGLRMTWTRRLVWLSLRI
jgi:hypothetical protein